MSDNSVFEKELDEIKERLSAIESTLRIVDQRSKSAGEQMEQDLLGVRKNLRFEIERIDNSIAELKGTAGGNGKTNKKAEPDQEYLFLKDGVESLSKEVKQRLEFQDATVNLIKSRTDKILDKNTDYEKLKKSISFCRTVLTLIIIAAAAYAFFTFSPSVKDKVAGLFNKAKPGIELNSGTNSETK